MYVVYIIKNLERRNVLYIGFTDDLSRRLKEHNAGFSDFTKKFAPWKLAYCEGYASEQDARDREKQLKHFGKVYSQLKRRILRSLQSK